jgi:very-short-patch-repair endonuclease
MKPADVGRVRGVELVDRKMEKIASRQHGCLSSWQLRQADVPQHLAEYRLRSGRWTVVTRGVWAMAAAPATWRQELMAAVLTHPQAILSGRAAASLHELPGFRRRPPEITVPWSASGRCGIATVHRTQHLSDLETVEVDGIRVLRVAETIFDIAHRTAPSHLERVTDHALLTGSITLGDLTAIHDRYLGERYKGIRKMRAIIAARHPDDVAPTRSTLEGRLREILAGPWLPAAHFGHQMLVGDQVIELDAWIPRWRLDVEADGRVWHARAEAFERDRRRDNLLISAGIRVLRFTASDLLHRRAEVVERVRAVGSALVVPTTATIAVVGTSNGD